MDIRDIFAYNLLIFFPFIKHLSKKERVLNFLTLTTTYLNLMLEFFSHPKYYRFYFVSLILIFLKFLCIYIYIFWIPFFIGLYQIH
uniref:Uncharacterized protein n=1 Tax=Physcomitrium patens TaxID=3218 RepID=A0A2K1J7B7_PHYPA|nr:hypothetical protein PHYPA_020517 [Physcomitrium patens]